MEKKEDVTEITEVDEDEDAVAEVTVTAAAASLKKSGKKKKKKEKKKKNADDSERNDDDDDDEKMVVIEKTKKKKSKAPASGIGDDGDVGGGEEEIELVSPGGKTKKKKKKKGESSSRKLGALTDSFASLDTTSPKPSSKKSVTKASPTKSSAGSRRNLLSAPMGSSTPPAGSKRNLLAVQPPSERKLYTVSHSDYDKYSAEYFQAILEEIRSKCDRKLKLKVKDKDAFAMTCQNYYDAWMSKQENDRWLTELVEGKNSKKNATEIRTTEQLIQAQTDYAKELDATVLKRQKWCIKSALNVFMGLKEDSLMGIEEKMAKGAIVAQATPEKLAEFASKSKQNEKLLKRLFGDPVLMKEMLLHGGAVKYEYGEAIRIYVDCMEDGKLPKTNDKDNAIDTKDDDEWTKIHRKIALACALELASPVYEFDTTKVVDPVARYKHFVEAHQAGELDPAFPFFSVWEMRQIVNCDAPNEQMTWCRKMVSIVCNS